MTGTIYKSIYFYKICLKKDHNYVNPLVIFNYINSLSFDETDTGRYQKLDEEKGLSIHIDSLISPLKFRVGTRRMDNLPDQENQGNVFPLNLPQDHVLFEPSHFMLYVDEPFYLNNIMGFEFNFYGPRVSRLKKYILEKASHLIDEVELSPLMNEDFRTKINRIGEIKKFEIGVHRDYGEMLREINGSLPDIVNAAKNLSDSEFVEIVLRPQKKSKNSIKFPVLRNFGIWEKLFNHPDFPGHVDKLRVRAENKYSEQIENFDLLQEFIVSKKNIIKKDDNHRAVDRDAMYYSINEAYWELRNEIFCIISRDNHGRN